MLILMSPFSGLNAFRTSFYLGPSNLPVLFQFGGCSSMIPRARSDQLFPKNGGVASLRTEEERSFLGQTVGRGGRFFGGGSFAELTYSRGSSIKKRQPANKERSRRRNRVLYPEDNQFNKLMNMMIERNTIQKRKKSPRKVKS